MKLYITYGHGTDRRDCYSVVEGTDYEDCRNKAFAATQGKFAFSYTEEQFKGQVERFVLREVELGPQVHL